MGAVGQIKRSLGSDSLKMNRFFFFLGVGQLAMWSVHGVVPKMGSLGMEMLKRDICLLSLVHSMIVRYPPLLVELTTLLPGLSPPKLCTVGVGE